MNQESNKQQEGLIDVLVTILTFYHKYKSKWKFIFLFGFIGVLAGVAIGLNSKPKFPSTSSIIIEGNSSNGLSSYMNLAKSFGLGEGTEGNLLTPENFTEIAKSKRIIYATLLSESTINGETDLLINHFFKLTKSNVIKDENGIEKPFLIKTKIPFQGSLQEERRMGSAYASIIENSIQIITSLENSIIKIKTTFSNENFSHVFATIYLQKAYGYFLNNILNQEQEILSLLRDKKDSIEGTLSIKQIKFADLNDRSVNVVKSRKSLEKLVLMKDIEILSAMLATTIQSLEISEFSSRESKKIFKIIDEPVLPLIPEKKGTAFSGIIFGILFSSVKFGHMIFMEKFKEAKKKTSKA